MISKTEIKRIASRICTADVRCPVFDAGADCSCDAEHGYCPIVKALELANETERKPKRLPVKWRRKCDFYAVLGYGKDARFVCTLGNCDTRCDGCLGKCHCPKTREKRRQAIVRRLRRAARK